jgi:hypothetical protein
MSFHSETIIRPVVDDRIGQRDDDHSYLHVNIDKWRRIRKCVKYQSGPERNKS